MTVLTRVKLTLEEFRARTLVSVANRSFTSKQTPASWVSLKLVQLLLGKPEELDADFDHSSPM